MAGSMKGLNRSAVHLEGYTGKLFHLKYFIVLQREV